MTSNIFDAKPKPAKPGEKGLAIGEADVERLQLPVVRARPCQRAHRSAPGAARTSSWVSCSVEPA